jgi:hypothetical protein
MAFKLADLVKDTTTTTGTGSYTLSGAAATGYQDFLARIGNANQCCYCVRNGADTEVGIGTLTDGTTLSRDMILESSNSDEAVNWPAGTKDIYVTLSAKLAVFLSTPLAGAGDAGKLVKVAAGGLLFDLAAQGAGGGVDADKLDGKHFVDINPMTAVGDMIIGGTAGAATRLAVGAAGTYPRSNGTTRVASAVDGGDIGSGTVPSARLPTAATGAQGAVTKATKAQMEGETADRYPDATSVKYHPGTAKDWISLNGTGTISINGSYNVASITDAGTGDYTVTRTTAHANGNGSVMLSSNGGQVVLGAISAGSFHILTQNSSGAPVDVSAVCATSFGQL